MEPGAPARPDPGRSFSTLLTLIPGATSQEAVRFQRAPYLQYQSVFRSGKWLRLRAARSHLGTALAAKAAPQMLGLEHELCSAQHISL